MAIVVDEARPAATTVLCANETYQVAPETWDIGFSLLPSVAEPTIDDTTTSPMVAAAPTVDFSAFWLPSVPATLRL